jgi:hypothetical protein
MNKHDSLQHAKTPRPPRRLETAEDKGRPKFAGTDEGKTLLRANLPPAPISPSAYPTVDLERLPAERHAPSSSHSPSVWVPKLCLHRGIIAISMRNRVLTAPHG